MSDADIMAALDGWLDDGPPADLIKPDTQAVPPANRESFVVSAVTKAVTTETVPDAAGDEAQRCEARAKAFMAKGIPGQAADMLASSLMQHDRLLDDRRSCAECTSFHEGRCLQRITPIGETTIHSLHRCKGFKQDEGFND